MEWFLDCGEAARQVVRGERKLRRWVRSRVVFAPARYQEPNFVSLQEDRRPHLIARRLSSAIEYFVYSQRCESEVRLGEEG